MTTMLRVVSLYFTFFADVFHFGTVYWKMVQTQKLYL